MKEADKRDAFYQAGEAACLGFLQGLADDVHTSMLSGVAVHGEDGSVFFQPAGADSFRMRGISFQYGKDVDREMAISPQGAADLYANLTPGEIIEYMDRAIAGEHPSITDYVEEVI